MVRTWNEKERKELAKKAMDVVVESNNKKSDVVILTTQDLKDFDVYYSSNPSVIPKETEFVIKPIEQPTPPAAPSGEIVELAIADINYAADYDPQTKIANLFDGLKETRFSVPSPEIDIDKFVLGIDLGAEQKIQDIGLSVYKGDERQYNLKVQITNNPNIWNYTVPIKTSGKSQEFEFYPVGPAGEHMGGRYLRILGSGSNANKWNSYTGLKIRGIQITDVTPKPIPQPDPAGPNDKNGIKKFYQTDESKPSWFLSDNLDPNTDPEFDIDGDKGHESKVTASDHPKLGKIFTAKSREGGLASGGTQLTLRLHWNPLTSKGEQKSEPDYHQKIKQQGYIISPQDPRDVEQTAIFRLRGITKEKGRVTHKQHGGIHTGNHDPRASCFALMVSFEEKRDILAELELFHPDYQFFKTVKAIAGINKDSLENQWIGTKAICINEGDDVKVVLYLNTNPLGPNGEINNNNWQIYTEFTFKKGLKDDGGDLIELTPTWGGPIVTWRINEVKEVDLLFLSVRSIKAEALPAQ